MHTEIKDKRTYGFNRGRHNDSGLDVMISAYSSSIFLTFFF